MHLKNKQSGLTGILTCIDFNIDDSGSEIDLTIMLDNSGGECIDRQFYSLDELKKFLRDWEECKPAEPLIKDEKIRKAVRAWSEANEITNIYCHQYKRTCEFDCERLDLDCYATIRFMGDDIIDKNHNNDAYTITELCGEEEECER